MQPDPTITRVCPCVAHWLWPKSPCRSCSSWAHCSSRAAWPTCSLNPGGKAKFHYNTLGVKQFSIEATKPIPAGKTQVRMEFAYDGGGMGMGGAVTLYCDGKEVGKGRVEQTHGIVFSADETTDVGSESGTTVSPDYTAHTSRFNGKINWVQIDLGKDAEDADHYISPDERIRVAMARQ